MNPKIIYEDNDLIVIDKPSGLIVHRKNLDDSQPSVVDWVVKNYPELENIGEPFSASGKDTSRAGIVHRLDKEASGLLIIAKNANSFSYFKELFQNREIKKHYLALVSGRPKQSKGTITSPLGRIGLKRTTRIIGNKLIDKKDAETSYKTIKEYTDYTLLEVTPKTGRTHQIRVHLNSIQTPIAGDKIYSFKKAKTPSGLNRLFLHAYKLEFKTPDDKSLILETDLPEDLSRFLENLK